MRLRPLCFHRCEVACEVEVPLCFHGYEAACEVEVPLCFHRYEVACEVEVRLQSAGKQQPGSRPRIPPSPSSPAHCCAIFLSYLGGEIFHLVGQLTR